MSDHYRRQTQQLEALLARKLNEVDLLEKQHQVLQLKESALQSAIGALEGSLTCLTTTLEGSMPCADVTAAAAAQTSATAAHVTLHPANHPTSPVSPAQISSDSGTATPPSSGASSGVSTGAASGASPQQSGEALSSSRPLCSMSADAHNSSTGALEQILEREQRVQHVLQQLGGCTAGSYKQLYTTQLLQRALANEARTWFYLNHTKQERLRGWAKVLTQMALLLHKYDADLMTARGRTRALLDDLVDDMCGRFVASLLYQTPDPHLAVLMFNVDTLEFEPYPAGWWELVVQSVELSADQATSLKHVWGRAKVKLQKLTQECDHVLAQLRQLQQQQLQGIKSFGQTLEQLPCLQRAQERASTNRKQRQQQQQLSQQPEQQRQCGTSAQQMPAQHQQQQQQHSLAAGLPDSNAALQALHAAWQHEHSCANAAGQAARAAVGAEAIGNELIAELVTDLEKQHFEAQAPQQAVHSGHHHHNQQQQQQQQAGGQVRTAPAHTAGALSPAAALPNASSGSASAARAALVPPLPYIPLFLPSVGGAQHPTAAAVLEGQCEMPPGITGSGAAAVQMASLQQGDVDTASELWQESTEERLQLERQLQACTDKIKVVYFSLMLHIVNTLNKRQIAAMCVHAHPFVCDALSFCEALDSLDFKH